MIGRIFSSIVTVLLFVPISAELHPQTLPSVRREMSLEALIRDWYLREFGESIPRPAIFNDERAINCLGVGHLTTTAYLRTSTTSTDLLVLYTTRDGLNLIKSSRRNVLAPAGTFRVLSIIIRHSDTVGSTALIDWQRAQNLINRQHAQLAREHGYAAPIVAFQNDNVVLEPRELSTPENSESVAAAMESHHISPARYDTVVLINIDPRRPEGGRTTVEGQRSIYVGNFAHWTSPMGARDWDAIARTAYQQLMAYHWGWQTDWTPTCGGTQLGYEPFITSPTLMGWADVDGDGVPEILDHTPYGRAR
jgi:hypothetical protein